MAMLRKITTYGASLGLPRLRRFRPDELGYLYTWRPERSRWRGGRLRHSLPSRHPAARDSVDHRKGGLCDQANAASARRTGAAPLCRIDDPVLPAYDRGLSAIRSETTGLSRAE